MKTDNPQPKGTDMFAINHRNYTLFVKYDSCIPTFTLTDIDNKIPDNVVVQYEIATDKWKVIINSNEPTEYEDCYNTLDIAMGIAEAYLAKRLENTKAQRLAAAQIEAKYYIEKHIRHIIKETKHDNAK